MGKDRNGIGRIKTHHLKYHTIALPKSKMPIFSIFLLVLGCTSPEETDSSNTALFSEAYFEQVILENGGTIEYHEYTDKFGNVYDIPYGTSSLWVKFNRL